MIRTNIFKKYPNSVFIETGSYFGDGINYAIEAGYDKIYSIELSDKYYDICTNRFRNNTNVTIIKGDSCEKLNELIQEIDCPVTFWLDGHYSCGDTALGKYWTPLMVELEHIKQHKIKSHTILIDDMRCWVEYNENHGFVTNDIIEKVKEINSEYIISFEDGYVENDVLVAKL